MSADDISERYLKKAIAEIIEWGQEDRGGRRPRTALPSSAPAIPSPTLPAQVRAVGCGNRTEGVAALGRAGQGHPQVLSSACAPTLAAIYGTNRLASEGGRRGAGKRWLERELHIVQPKLIVVMGQDALECLNAVSFPAAAVATEMGTIQRFTATIDALVVPDIDASLDEQATKREFWNAFKAIGPWWSELVPY